MPILTPEFLAKHPVTILPHRIKIGNSFFEEDADFTSEDMFRKLAQVHQTGNFSTPEVQVPNINAVLDQLPGQRRRRAGGGHPHEQPPQPHVEPIAQGRRDAAGTLFDPRAGQPKYLVRPRPAGKKAAEAATTGAGVNDIARIVNGAVPHLYLAVFTESLNYLERSANLGPSQSLLGTMLGIKAMLMLEEGKLVTQEKVQTRDEVVEKLHEFVVEFAAVKRARHLPAQLRGAAERPDRPPAREPAQGVDPQDRLPAQPGRLCRPQHAGRRRVRSRVLKAGLLLLKWLPRPGISKPTETPGHGAEYCRCQMTGDK